MNNLTNHELEIQPALSYEGYENLALTKINGTFHAMGRIVLNAYTAVRMGSVVIDVSDEFNALKGELLMGGNVLTPTHRDDLDTVLLPCVFEKVGLHHSRPTAKEDLTHLNPAIDRVAWRVAQKWGAFPFRRGSKDFSGMNRLKSIVLDPEQRVRNEKMSKIRKVLADRSDRFKYLPGNITDYNEMTRVTDDVLNVKREGSGVVHTAGEYDSWIIPFGQAGLSKVKNPIKDENGKKHTLYKDKKSWFGIRERMVVSVGAPFKLGKLHNLDEYRAGRLAGEALEEFRMEIARRSEIVYDSMQVAHERAYEIRGSSLEVDLYSNFK